VLCFSFHFSIFCIAFCKRGGDFPLFTKTILFLSSWQYSHQVNYYLSCECIVLSLFSLSYLLFLLPAIGKKILNQKVFFFLFWGIFYLSHKHKESKEYGHRKVRLKNSRSSSLTYFLSLFYGGKTKPPLLTAAHFILE